MKFWAILKDSVREAVDTKVFYVTLGLSTLLIMFVASISYRPVTVEDDAKFLARLLSFFTGAANAGRGMPQFEIANYEKTGGDEPWKASYRFDLVARFTTAADRDAFVGKGATPGGRDQVADMLKKAFFRFETVEMGDRDLHDPLTIHYPVTVKGSKIDNARDWAYEPSLLFAIPLPFWRASLSGAVYTLEDSIVNTVGGWIIVLTGIVITSFFIPNMLRKGTVDLLLAKPLGRWRLLLYKYVGGLSFIFLNTAYIVVGLWVVLGLRSGIWAPLFLLSIFILTFFFAILYAVSTLFAVLTRSPVVAIMMTVVTWAVLFAVGIGDEWIETRRIEESKPMAVVVEPIINRWWAKGIESVHYVLPRAHDLDLLTTQLLSEALLSPAERKSRGLDKDVSITWAESLSVSGAFIAVLLGLSCWRFTVQDY